MPFSSSICLTNTGTLPSGSNVSVYSNANNYSTPFQTNIPLSQLTSNCPYILSNIPDGTTHIKFEDTVSHCCCDLTLTDNNLCNLFGIQLTNFSSTTISQIIAGVLISSVGANITDYIIDWYGPDNNTTVAFTSGFGTLFGPYQQTHPFTRVSSPGYYVPMIRQIRINGINYSKTGGAGFVQANIDCLENQTVEVFPSKCSGNMNGTEYFYPDYNNYYFSDTAAYNTPPEPLSLGFDLDMNSNYFAWQFRAYSVSDTIKITFHGDNYPTPIILEYYTVGSDYTNTNVSVIPKTINVGSYSFFKKITNISNFLRTENDYLTIEVTPNPNISRTNWELYFKCLSSFDCSTCLDSLAPYKFIDCVSMTSLGCNVYNFSANISGCTDSVLRSSDIYKYLTNGSGIGPGPINSEFYGWCSTPNGEYNFTSPISSGSTFCNVISVNGVDPYYCDSNPGGFISFSKTNDTVGGPGNIRLQFQNLSDLNLYYQSYLNNVFAYGLGTPFDDTNIDYYRYFSLVIPIIPSNDPDRTCASDSGNIAQYSIHTSSVVTTGVTGNFYFLNITMPLMNLGISFDSCDLGCLDSANSIITAVNTASSSQNNQYNFYSNVGAKKLNPISSYAKLYKYTVGTSTYGQSAFLRLTDLVNNTIPMTNDTHTPIPSLSAQTCSFSGYIKSSPYLTVIPYIKYAWSYSTTVTLLNIYEIYTYINGVGNILLYQYNLNTNTLLYKNPNYFIGTPCDDLQDLIIPVYDIISNNIPNNNLGDNVIPNNDVISNNIPDNNLGDDIIPNNDIISNNIPNNNLGDDMIPNNDVISNILL